MSLGTYIDGIVYTEDEEAVLYAAFHGKRTLPRMDIGKYNFLVCNLYTKGCFDDGHITDHGRSILKRLRPDEDLKPQTEQIAKLIAERDKLKRDQQSIKIEWENQGIHVRALLSSISTLAQGHEPCFNTLLGINPREQS